MNTSDRRATAALPAGFRGSAALQVALLFGQLERLPELRERRAHNAALLESLIRGLPAIRLLPPQPEMTAPTMYCYVFQYRPEPDAPAPHRDLFVAAIEAEGIPCDGRFYEAVYRSDLFHSTPENCAQLHEDYSRCHCPAAERAAYEEAVWLFQFCFLGGEEDIRDMARAIEKVATQLDRLAAADPSLAGVKAMGRAQRARYERNKNY